MTDTDPQYLAMIEDGDILPDPEKGAHRQADRVLSASPTEPVPVSSHSGNAPLRVQLSRKKGWRLPENTVVVARPTKWGNPYRVGATVHFGPSWSGRDSIVQDAKEAVRLFRRWVFNLRSATDISELRDKNLACWCPLDQPCHADVLLELANAQVGTHPQGGDAKQAPGDSLSDAVPEGNAP
jgi:hypothetical protein